MAWDHGISSRGSLAAPSSDHQIYVLSSIILAVSVLSALGAGWIMLSFFFFKQLRSFRHQLILGLAFSDFVMAINFLSSAAMNVNGRDIGYAENKDFCSYNGFMTQVFVIQTDYWVLAIGICTYFILADHHTASSWVQDHIYIVGSLPWAFSILWAVVGLLTAGYGNIGAWCWFTSDKVRLLVNFIPRWIIILAVLIMYARLYAVLFRAHRFMSSSEENSRRGGASRVRDAAGNGSSAHAFGRGGRQPPSTKRLKKLARLMIMYPLAYIVIWTLPTSIRIYQSITGKAAPFALQTVDKSCIVIQGVIDALIYGINESSLAAWREHLFPRSYIDNRQGGPSVYQMSSRPGPQHSRAQAARPSHESLDETSSTAHITMGTDYDDTAEHPSGMGFGADARADRDREYGIEKTVEVSVSFGSRAS